MTVINKLVDKGNTILIIEHNMDVIKLADYIIDIGPEGKGGGQVVAKGTQKKLLKQKKKLHSKVLEKRIA
jgi:excinuclease ABC subunit A